MTSEDSCYFCGDADNLINMDHNSLIINAVYIDFAQLIYDLMQTRVSPAIIRFFNNFTNFNCFRSTTKTLE